MVVLMKQVLDALLRNAIAPAVARSGDLDEAVKTLKKSVVGFTATQASVPKDVLAKHFGKSDRWVYRYLEDLSREKRQGKATGELQPPPRSLIEKIMQLVVSQYPTPLTAQEIQAQLERDQQRVDLGELQALLGLYADIGLLKAEALGADGEVTGFASPARVAVSEARALHERINLVALRSRAIFPIAMSYVQGDEEARFSYTQVRLMRKHLQAAIRDCRKYMVERFNQAVEDSLKEDPEERAESEVVDYTLLFLGGVRRFDDQK